MLKNSVVVALLMFPAFAGEHPKVAAESCSEVLAGQIPRPIGRETSSAKYHFVTEYTLLGPQGMQTGTHVITAEFVASDKDVRWMSVTVGKSAGHGEPSGTSEHQAFIEGFEYERDAQKITAPEFFRSFPANTEDEKNLVWDELMFHSFVDNVDRLRINQPVLAQSGDVMLAGSGKFTNRRIELTLLGVGRRNGEDCLLVHYEALLNRFTVTGGGVTVAGRSDYFGDIWVSLRTRQIEYATLLEEVAGVIGNIPNSGPQPLHVLRTATLERLP